VRRPDAPTRQRQRDRRWLVLVLLSPFVLAVTAYFGTYFYARASHKLVNYGDFIARPNAMSGIGFTLWELVFVPATELESWVRRQRHRVP